MIPAIAKAADANEALVRRAVMLTGDIGRIARAAMQGEGSRGVQAAADDAAATHVGANRR